MGTHFLQDIHYSPERTALLQRACLSPDSDEAELFLQLVRHLAPHAHPKAFVMAAVVDSSLPSPILKLDGVEFSGSVLYEKVEDASTVYPFIVTCGTEMDAAVAAIADPFKRFWGELILEDALDTAKRELDAFVALNLIPVFATLSPGSLPEWPLSQQLPLFTLLGNAPRQCGITLTPNLLMLPNKSLSGIIFPASSPLHPCALCGRVTCPNRVQANAAFPLPLKCESIGQQGWQDRRGCGRS